MENAYRLFGCATKITTVRMVPMKKQTACRAPAPRISSGVHRPAAASPGIGSVTGIGTARRAKTNRRRAENQVFTLANPLTSGVRTTSVFRGGGVAITTTIAEMVRMRKGASLATVQSPNLGAETGTV